MIYFFREYFESGYFVYYSSLLSNNIQLQYIFETNNQGLPRSVSLVPSIHIAVIRMDQIIEDLKELYFRPGHDPEIQEERLTNCMTFISGPSKTGDIELVMVHGAHGPRELIIFVVAH